jgi:hypothetical protein
VSPVGKRALVALVAVAAVALYAAWARLRAGDRLGVSRAPVPAGVLGSNGVLLAPVGVEDAGAPRYLKGQLHLHTDYSGDGHASPEDVARWYAARGYDFIVFTDHDFITSAPGVDGLLALPGVELTTNLPTCRPEPPPGLTCNLHVNALFADPVRAPLVAPRTQSTARLDVYASELEQAAALGALAQLNHPNFRFGADASLLAQLALRGARLLEVANQASDSLNEGDGTHPSTERLWDEVLTQGATLFAVATDDAHDYLPADLAARRARGEDVFVGDLGFVMVHAAKSPAEIRAALARGDFYASTGVLLERVEVVDGVLRVTASGTERLEFTFVGEGGRVLGSGVGRSAQLALDAARMKYVRCVVTDAAKRRAWTQPVWTDPSRAP